MKKKILSFIFVLHIFCYCVLCPCVSIPVKAEVSNIPVAVEMWDGFQTLFFTLGVSLLASDAVDKMAQMEEADQSILALANNLDTAAAEVLKNDWNDYKTNLQYGYCKISNNLWTRLKNNIYATEISQGGLVGSLPSDLRAWFSSHAGYYFIQTNYPSSGNGRFLAYRCDTNIFNTPVLLNTYSDNTTSWRIIDYQYFSQSTRLDFLHYQNGYFESTFWTLSGWEDRETYALGNNLDYTIIHNQSGTFDNNSIAGNITQTDYNNALDDYYSVDNDGYIISNSTGTYPAVVPSSITDALIDDIGTGTLTWDDALDDVSDAEIDVPDGHLTLPELDALIDGLDIDRLETKFPFCIPHDMELMISGAASVSSNAPVIKIPLRLEFRGHVYYDENEAVVIDFNRFNSVVVIFREGFFLLFLLGLVYLTIEILQAFFVVTE